MDYARILKKIFISEIKLCGLEFKTVNKVKGVARVQNYKSEFR